MTKKSGGIPSYSVTSAGVNPAEDRAHRMRMYFVAMALRVACVASLFWLRGWWISIAVIGSIVLPWFAVMVGNAVAHGGEEDVSSLEPLQVEGSTVAADDSTDLLVVDVDPVRRSTDTDGHAETVDEGEDGVSGQNGSDE